MAIFKFYFQLIYVKIVSRFSQVGAKNIFGLILNFSPQELRDLGGDQNRELGSNDRGRADGGGPRADAECERRAGCVCWRSDCQRLSLRRRRRLRRTRKARAGQCSGGRAAGPANGRAGYSRPHFGSVCLVGRRQTEVG